jgi:hypothetical protein
MSIEQYKGKRFDTINEEDIRRILEISLDDDEWHTPGVSDIKIHTQNHVAVYGYCNLSRHNRYTDLEHWFNINSDTVQVWREVYERGRANQHLHHVTHNVIKLAEILTELKNNIVKPSETINHDPQ